MASPYLPLPPDSDNEDNGVPMSEDEEPESPSGYPYVPVRTDSDPDEEEPEEDQDTEDNSWEDSRTVPTSSVPIYSFEVPAPPRQTARMRVATPERVTLSPDHVTSTPDRHQMNMESHFSWELTLEVLRKWRNIGLGRSSYEQGETSEQREPLLDTTPIIVDRMLSHENRMDLLEDAIIHLPEPEIYDAIGDHVTTMEEDVIRLREEVQRLTAKLESTNMTMKGMESTVEKLTWQAQQTELMKVINFESEVYAMKKKDKEDEN